MEGTGTGKPFFSAKLKLKAVLKSVLVGLLVSVVLLLICSALMLWLSLPFVWATVMSYFAAAVGAFVGGCVGGLILKENGLRIGALIGFAILLVTFLTGLIIRPRIPSATDLLISLAVDIAAASLGGVFGVNKK